jgi:hypothetical protein
MDDGHLPAEGQVCATCGPADHVWCSAVSCETCGDMGAVEYPELLPCPSCDPALYLAELVMCGLPTDTADARLAAEKISPTIIETGSVRELLSPELRALLAQGDKPGEPW